MFRHPHSPRLPIRRSSLLLAFAALSLLGTGAVRAQSPTNTGAVAPIPPVIASVNVAATVPVVIARTGDPLVATFTRDGGDTTKKVLVYYALKGTAKNGTDYGFAKGRLKIKPNQTSARLSLKPIVGGASGTKTIRVTVRPNDAYLVGADKEVKLYIDFGG